MGLIEGVADAVASLIKLWSGCHSDIMSGRRKGLALAGYTLSNVARPLLGLARSWLVILVLRSIDAWARTCAAHQQCGGCGCEAVLDFS